VLDIAQLVVDPQILARESIVSVPDEDLRQLKM
jgi:hypothetical protein